MANDPVYGSAVINGQLLPVFDIRQFASGNAQGPRLYGSIPNVPQTIPLVSGNAAVGGAPSITGASGFALTPTLAVVLIIMLVVGILGLRYIHWRG